jgi:arylsulfatase A-like enzyme/Tfp pilus assembly protein PilF
MRKSKTESAKNRFTFSLFSLCLFLSIFSSVSPWYSVKETEDGRLNFLLITIDTLRADRLSCYSREHLKTPIIDSLAKKGKLFSRAFANTSTTLPSHTNILLGTTPLYHGVHDNTNFIVREEFLTLAEHLKSYGYHTGAFVGAYPLDSRIGLNQGFDTYDDDYGRRHRSKNTLYVERRAEVVVDRALDWLKVQKSPWFLWVHCFDPHDPYEPPEPFKTQYEKQPYDGEVAYVDFVLAKLFDYLDVNELSEKTLIIFTGDHGESLGQHGEMTHGFFAYNTAIWIPLIISIPGIDQGQVEQYVSHIDIFPTVCDVLDIESPSFLKGVSLLPGIKGKKLPKMPIYFESMYPYHSRGWAPLRGFIYGKEKYIDSPIPELYDVDDDFDELKNLAERKKLDEYRKKLEVIIKNQSLPENVEAKRRFDRESLEKLRSLGYVSASQVSKKESFGPEDDVKVLLPYHNKAMKALDLFEEGKVREGLELLKEVITERKDIDIAYSNLAALYKEAGKMDEACEVLKLGLENISSSYEIFFNYVRLLIKSGQYDEAIKAFNEKNFRQMEHDPEIWNNLGLAYAKKRDFEKAIEAYEKTISIDNEYPFAFRNLGQVYFSIFLKTKDQRTYQKSLENFKKAIELDPEYALAYVDLGSAYIKVGNFDRAIYCWEKALELRPDIGQTLYHLGLAYLNKGNKVKALGYFNKYKDKYYGLLPDAEKLKLDALIQKCMKEP